MSLIVPNFDESVIVRSAEAEVIGEAPTTIRLLADSSSPVERIDLRLRCRPRATLEALPRSFYADTYVPRPGRRRWNLTPPARARPPTRR